MAQRSDIDGEPSRSPILRLLAPAALLVTGLVVIVVISSSLGGGDSAGEGGGEGGQRAGNTEMTTTEAKTEKAPKKYTVQPGDSLSAIADRFGIEVTEILELNPDVDPQALVTGENLKLR